MPRLISQTDIIAAVAAKMRIIHYLYVKKELEGADAVVESLQELPDAIKTLD